MPPIKLQLNLTSVWKQMWFTDFQDGCHGGHLGYQNGNILAILNLHAAPMLSTKFPLHPTYSSGGDKNWRLSRWMLWLPSVFVLRFYGPVNQMGSCRVRSVYLTTVLLGRLSPLSGLTSIVHILLPETDNCPSWISWRERTTIETRGPWATVRSPEWHSHCRYADVMQHFSSPIIATNENIIIWAVLSFEEVYMGLTVNGAWSFE